MKISGYANAATCHIIRQARINACTSVRFPMVVVMLPDPFRGKGAWKNSYTKVSLPHRGDAAPNPLSSGRLKRRDNFTEGSDHQVNHNNHSVLNRTVKQAALLCYKLMVLYFQL